MINSQLRKVLFSTLVGMNNLSRLRRLASWAAAEAAVNSNEITLKLNFSRAFMNNREIEPSGTLVTSSCFGQR
ncbi:MAG: hypothetical protein ACTS6G_01230 [Candidatus Hodgkinia cicadicola]